MSRVSFSSVLTIVAGSTPDEPSTDTLVTSPGRLVLFRFIVPPGPRGEVSLWLKQQQRQIVPNAPAVYDNLDDDVIETPVDLYMGDGQYDLTLCGSAPYANFDHQIRWEVIVETEDVSNETASLGGAVRRLAGLFG